MERACLNLQHALFRIKPTHSGTACTNPHSLKDDDDIFRDWAISAGTCVELDIVCCNTPLLSSLPLSFLDGSSDSGNGQSFQAFTPGRVGVERRARCSVGRELKRWRKWRRANDVDEKNDDDGFECIERLPRHDSL
ncbi:hypothetical protein BLNAU_13671 [Blattamonas nauphoetae]|uniref:Uncharacterized protein n=1 Tax=Blattamonas nauphoetae TaxID=2049346 RepID=A0ABQ9XH96_9EUKA|nr:hypothetical protein BLNAU_13671 [Blattamonas nauphoetae]